MSLTAERLRDVILYSPDTGVMTWRIDKGHCRAGAVAGGPSGKSGYWQVRVDMKRYYAHRLAWLHVYGHWPAQDIDHINGDPADNRIANLRDVATQTNLQNSRRAQRGSKVGLLGVSINRRGKYVAQIRINGKQTWLGDFDDAQSAHERYLAAKRIHHPGFVA